MSIKEIITYHLEEIIRSRIGELDLAHKYETLDEKFKAAYLKCHENNCLVLSSEFWERGPRKVAEEIYEALFKKGEEDLLLKQFWEKFERKRE